jgi:tRNA pseudouridine38-40 synthase
MLGPPAGAGQAVTLDRRLQYSGSRLLSNASAQAFDSRDGSSAARETAQAMIVRLILSYRGDRYAGWQLQANAISVQEEVERALTSLLGGPHRVIGASRTDAGVHARGQAAHVALARPFPLRGLVHGTNHRLPKDVRVVSAAVMADGFHARRSASGKEYVYQLIRARVLSPLDAPLAVAAPTRLDLAAMRLATGSLVGRHDFSSFALAGGSHRQPFRRISSAIWEEQGAALHFRIRGEGFLRGMVRSLVGTLLEVGTGRRTSDDFCRLLIGGTRNAAGPTAPPHGLILERVFYPASWQPLEVVEAGGAEDPTSAENECPQASAEPSPPPSRLW